MDEADILPTRTSYLPIVWAAIASVGWYILGVLVALFFASPYIAEKYKSWKNKKDKQEYDSKYKKNPDLQEERLRAIEAARQRMQSKYNETLEEAERRKEAEKAEKIRELEKFRNSTGPYRLGDTQSGPSTSKPKYNEYNPLMGDTTRNYKPPKRSACRGGGCGGS
ncbi:uncharacterized protein [Fopius arisanus]|uniref:Selenoprotein S n=1 Tax=Fopius arisanus TaxID=64838 RepID=A0A9R1TJN3_9HYME|nr:PREDICTED: uncharacterized protein LOC105270934 [Fopius arisanus]